MLYYIYYNKEWRSLIMRLQRSKSKNSISYYITEGFRNEKGVSTSRIVEKLGTAAQIIK